MITWNTEDLVAATNADWVETLTLGVEPRDWDLAGATAIKMQLRAGADGADPLITLDLTEGLAIVGDGTAFQITSTVPAAMMATFQPGLWSYDVVVTTATGQAIRAKVGTVRIDLGITRA